MRGHSREQRCPTTPPVRAKGTPVWLDLDQEDLDEAYDQSVYAFNSRNIAERLAANNEKALSAIGRPERVAYAGIVFNDHTDEDGAVVFRHACKLGLECFVSKRLSSPYRSGPSRDWIKVKNWDSPAMARFREGRWKR